MSGAVSRIVRLGSEVFTFMAKNALREHVQLSLDGDLAHQADELFREMGLSLSAACEIFVRQSLLEGGMPFDYLLVAGQA